MDEDGEGEGEGDADVEEGGRAIWGEEVCSFCSCFLIFFLLLLGVILSIAVIMSGFG
jgi:hypothetical protein